MAIVRKETLGEVGGNEFWLSVVVETIATTHNEEIGAQIQPHLVEIQNVKTGSAVTPTLVCELSPMDLLMPKLMVSFAIRSKPITREFSG